MGGMRSNHYATSFIPRGRGPFFLEAPCHRLFFTTVGDDMYVFFLLGSFHGPSEILSQVAILLADVPNICSPSASVDCLPSVLYLLNGVIKYHCKIGRPVDAKDRESFQKVMHSIKSILNSTFLQVDEVKESWTKLIRG